MSFTVRKERIRDIDDERKVISFDPYRHGKITGSRLLAVLGKDPYQSEFKAACLIGRFFSEYEPSIYTEAGEAIEPKIRSYVNTKAKEEMRSKLGLGDGKLAVQEPVDKKLCNYDHFGSQRVFGGMVDGYIRYEGKPYAVLEIKTANDRSKWFDENGEMTKVPEGYLLQASLYATLSGLEKIVFAVGFPTEADYYSPEDFIVTEDNFAMVVVDRKDLTAEMEYAENWFNKYILKGETPEWSEADEELVGKIKS